jgi:hypothetical protein
LKIARLYLEDADPVQAEAYINRASLLQTDSQNHELQIHYKVIYISLKILLWKITILDSFLAYIFKE